MLKSLTIKNYKSLYNITIELGRINIFIGENGCGKTNILEALAVAGTSKALDMDAEGLYNRGVRPAKPNLTFSSFKGLKQNKKIRIDLEFQERDEFLIVPSVLYCEDENDIYCKWKDEFLIHLIDETELHLNKKMQDIITHKPVINKRWFINDFSQLTEYVVYSLNTKSLRGINSESRKTPLGINGESLDILLSQFSGQEWDQLTKYSYLIFWLDEIFTDEKDSLKFKGHKLGRSNSILYFKDRFMRKKEMNNIFSAENANDGVLYILFYLALFISRKTPCFFGIDNIETCLNPRVSRTLIKELSKLSGKNSKQALITTHNPAVLDGLNLNDDEQRLFVVSRNDEGKTQVRRITLKPGSDEKLKLSEMWMRGYLGGLPNNF